MQHLLDLHDLVEFCDSGLMRDHQNKFPVASLAKEIENSGVGVAVEVVEAFVQQKKRAPDDVVHPQDKSQIAPLPFAAAPASRSGAALFS